MSQSSGLAKTILQATVKGNRKKEIMRRIGVKTVSRTGQRYFRCRFVCFMFGAVQCFNFTSVKVAELPPVWKRTANSAYHL